MKTGRAQDSDSPAASAASAGGAPGKRTLVQRRYGGATSDPDQIQEAAVHGTSGSAGELPHLAPIQASFGRHDVSGIQAHTDAAAADGASAMGAEAFASGNHVAFAGGPSLHTAAHEAAHVVQQRAGVHLKGGVGEVGDVHERHADEVADRVVQGKSAEDLLDAYTAPGAPTGVGRAAVQRAVKTNYGEFKTAKYDAVGQAGKEHGIDIELEFDPGNNVDAKKIGLTQSIVYHVNGKDVTLDPSQDRRMVTGADGTGSQIDRISPYSNPLYAADTPGANDKLGDTATVAGWGQHGWNYTDGGAVKHQKATLIDKPALPGRGNNSKQIFESAALAVEGRQAGSYMGSVEWGWEVDGKGAFRKLPLTLKSSDIPSKGFMEAAKLWNAGTTMGTVKTKADGTNVYDAAYAVAFTLPKDTTVTIDYPVMHNGEIYSVITVASGPDVGKTGNIKTSDLADQGDGAATIDLPIQWAGTIVVPASMGNLATLRKTASSSGTVLADLPVGTRVKVMDDSHAWVHVEVDTSQKGIVLNQTGTKGKDAAQMVRGFVSKELITR